MTTKHFIVSFSSIALFALALTAQAATTTPSTTNRLQALITRSDNAITARINDLNKLASRVGELKRVSDTEKATITSTIQTNISGLTALKAKIDADTDLATAQSDAKQITGSFRIYVLVVPQGWIAAAADRINTIVGMLTTIGTKLQTKISAAQSAGKDVTTEGAALTDFNAKLADATSQAAAAQSGIANLVPDQGDKTKLAANTTALKAARADIKTATEDLQAARTDAKNILEGLKALGQ